MPYTGRVTKVCATGVSCGALLMNVSSRKKFCIGCIHSRGNSASRTSRLSRSSEIAMYRRAQRRAREQSIPFNLELADIVIPETCPLLGIPLYRTSGEPTPNSPSLDKVIPALGYVKGNVQVISNRANLIKNNASLEEMETLVNNWKAQAVTQ
jgi:hypothetical protein